MSSLINLYGKQITFKEMFATDAFLNDLSDKFNLMSKEEAMQYELPLLFLFVDYAKKTYSNKINIVKTKSFLGEEYKGLAITSKHNHVVDVSEILVRALYPEYGREDHFESEEEVRVILTTVKSLIDSYNRF